MIRNVLASVLLAAGFAGTALADHSFQTMLDADNQGNVFQAVHNLKKTKGKDTVCDFTNSIQIPVGYAADQSTTWRQVILCFENKAQMEAAHRQMNGKPLMSYGVVSTYGLPVYATMDVEYVMNEDGAIKNIIGLHFH